MVGWRIERERALVVLENDRRPELRAEAAEALCELAAQHPDAALDFAVDVARLLADSQPELRCAGLALASQVLPPTQAAEVISRSAAEPDERVRVEAAGRLADLAMPDRRGVLAALLEDPSFAVRFEAARGMAALSHRAGLTVLVEALGHEELCFRALNALAELGDPAAIPAVRRLFRRWLLPVFERTQAAGVLARLGDPEGAQHLFSRIGRRWTPDRAMAIELCGELKLPGAFPRLSAIVQDRRDPSRGAAARGLGRLGDLRATPILIALLHESGRPEDLLLDAAEGLCLVKSAEGRAAVQELVGQLDSAQARHELRILLEETK